MKRIKAGRHILISLLVLAILLMTLGLYSITALADGQGPASGKHLVIKVVEDEGELFDLQDRAVPLAAFPGTSQNSSQPDGSGARHIVLMAVMLACVVVFAIYYGHNEKKLIRLRNKATRAEYRWMLHRRQAAEQSE